MSTTNNFIENIEADLQNIRIIITREKRDEVLMSITDVVFNNNQRYSLDDKAKNDMEDMSCLIDSKTILDCPYEDFAKHLEHFKNVERRNWLFDSAMEGVWGRVKNNLKK